uniref:Eukaryotic translation initiation factor 4E binding protein 1 n=1 Tax=Cynoglossus semilaevis TaxID=244447 RepID=A0A3P8W8X0_CYNSE
LCAGQSSSSTPDSVIHVFMDLALCTGAQSWLYSTTPGGTLFSTTPGGAIIYDRKFLLDRRSSPLAKTAPCGLPNIPGVTSPKEPNMKACSDDAQFEMYI